MGEGKTNPDSTGVEEALRLKKEKVKTIAEGLIESSAVGFPTDAFFDQALEMQRSKGGKELMIDSLNLARRMRDEKAQAEAQG